MLRMTNFKKTKIKPIESSNSFDYYNPNEFRFYSTIERQLIEALKSIEKTMNLYKKIAKDKNAERNMMHRWIFAALVMDRLFLYITITYFLATFSCFVLLNKN